MPSQSTPELQRIAAKRRRDRRPFIGSVPPGERLRGSGEDLEKYCPRCDDWWPATAQFFFRAHAQEGQLFYCCKACFADWRLTHPRKSQARAR